MNKVILLFFSAIFLNCGGNSSNKVGQPLKKLTQQEKIKFKQYKVQGEKIYELHCQTCHQKNGKGLAKLYPPLSNSDYLLEDFSRAAYIIKAGQSEEIVVNGITYNQMMPAAQLTHLEMAEVLTFIANNWENKAGFIDVKMVNSWLKANEQ